MLETVAPFPAPGDHQYPHHLDGLVTAEAVAADIAAHPEAYHPVLDHDMAANGIAVQRPQFETAAVERAEADPIRSHDWAKIAKDVPISPAHQAEHDSLGRALDAAYDERTDDQRYAIDVTLEVGQLVDSLEMTDMTERHQTAQNWIHEHPDGFNVADIPGECANEVIAEVLDMAGGVPGIIAKGIGEHIEMMPELQDVTVEKLMVLNQSDKNILLKFAARYPDKVVDNQLFRSGFEHPEVLEGVVRARPDLAMAMSGNLRLTKNMKSPVEIFDKLDTDVERSSFLHHLDVIQNPKTSAWMKDMSYAVIRLETLKNGFGNIDAGAVNYDSSFKPEDNKIFYLPIPLASGLTSEAKPPMKLFKDMEPDERAMITTDEYTTKHKTGNNSTESLTLPDLKPEFQELVIGGVLANAAEASNDPDQQAIATQRNVTVVESGVYVQPGDLLHTSSVASMHEVLQGGLVCGELIGEDSVNDAYPLNVDFNEVLPTDIASGNFVATVNNATAERHGTHANCLVTYVLRRDNTDRQQYPDRPAQLSQPDHKHRLIFGAVPSTEISSIIIADQGDDHEAQRLQVEVLETVLGQNTYYPVLSNDGNLLLSPDEFKQRVSSRLDELRTKGVAASSQLGPGNESIEQSQTLPLDVPLTFIPPTMSGFSF